MCLWSTIIDAERFRGLSDGAGWLYARLYALAGREGKDGVLALSVEGLSWRLREPRRKLVARLEELRDRGLIGLRLDAVTIADWSREQAEETEAERKRRLRAEKKNHHEGTPDINARNSTASSPRTADSVRRTSGRTPVNVRLDSDEDAEIDAEKDEEHHPTSPGDTRSSLKSTSTKRATRLSANWRPNEVHEEIANGLGLDLDSETAKFRDHAQANGRLLTDWNAGFRSWLRNAIRFSGNTTSKGRSRTERIVGAGREALRMIEEADARREARRV